MKSKLNYVLAAMCIVMCIVSGCGGGGSSSSDSATVSTPTFSPAAGTYSMDRAVTINCSTVGATIYYTIDGSNPTTSSPVYGSPISVAGDGKTLTISALAVCAGMTNSAIFTAAYRISYSQVSTPNFSITAGTYNSDKSVTITCDTAGATIYYTTDGNPPTLSSSVFNVGSPISVVGNGTIMTISALAVKAGMTNSTVASAKYIIDYAGFAQWAKPMSAASNECQFTGVAVDSSGNTYAVGYVSGTGSFNFGGNSTSFNGVSASYKSAVIVKYNASGVVLWATPVSAAPGNSQFTGVGVDSSGNAYASGFVDGGIGTINFGGSSSAFTPYLNPGPNAVVVKYNSSGSAQWAKSAVSAFNVNQFNGIAVDSAGNSYLAGSFYSSGSFNFGGNSSTFNGAFASGNNTLIVKYDSSGVAQWATPIRLASHVTEFTAVAVDGSGNTYAVGTVIGSGSFSFGGASLAFNGANSSSGNVVIVKYNSSGAAQWATPIVSAASSSFFTGVAVDSSSNAYAVGYLQTYGSFNFGTGAIHGSSQYNGVIVKYNSSGTAQWATTTVNGSTSYFRGIAVDSSGNAYAAGYIEGLGPYDFGGNSVSFNPAVSSYPNAVVVKYNSSGVAQLAVPINTVSSSSRFNGVAVDSSGNMYAAGYVAGTGSFSFGGNSAIFNGAYAGGYSSVIVKYYK